MADDQAFQDAGHYAGPECRALTVRPRPEDGRRPMAGFVAQLIACDGRMAQFRRARREDPSSAVTAYGAGAELAPLHLAIDFKI